MSGVRVLRLIEYEFVDQKTADRNLGHMTHSMNTVNMRMRSSIIQSPMTTEETKALAGNLAVVEDHNDGRQDDPS